MRQGSFQPFPQRPDDVRLLVDRVIDRVLAGERADRALGAELRRRPDLSSEERACVADWALALCLWRGRIDRLAQGDRSLWLALLLVDQRGLPRAEAALLGGADPLRMEAVLAHSPTVADPAETLAFERSLPLWLARRWIDQLGQERADSLAAAMNERGPITIRTNTLRTTRDGLIAALAREGVIARPAVLSPHALHLEGRPNIVALDAWRQGLFEVQDEGSQLIAEALEAQPGELIVDLCAGSGGKTLALAAAMRNKGTLVAIDVERQRLADLEVRARRAGVTCLDRRAGDGREAALTRDLVGRADRVLVDAPCSSLGVLRRGPDARWRLQPEDLARFPPLQTALLQRAATLVRPGGRLLYATCSVDPAEDEDVASSLQDSAFVLAGERRLWPDRDGCDGFYWAEWRRSPCA